MKFSNLTLQFTSRAAAVSLVAAMGAWSAVSFAASPAASPAAPAQAALAPAPAPATAGNNLVLKVNGMVCAFCAQGIEKRLTALPQTQSVYVNLGQKLVAVQSKPGQKFDMAKVKLEVVDAGYEVTAIDPTAKTTAQIKSELLAKK